MTAITNVLTTAAI